MSNKKDQIAELISAIKSTNGGDYFSKDWVMEKVLRLKKCESCGEFGEDKICKNCNRDNRINEIIQ
jgi:recombinational DNA repair protein RecR